MNILIVDDDPFTLNILQPTLEKSGYHVLRARNAEEALDRLKSEDIRLLITDWEIPGMNGPDLCRAVRSDEINGYVYVIMLTGRGDARSRRDGLNAGADGFLNKPLDIDELLVCLKTAERILRLETRDVALFALAKLAESRDADTGAHVERVQSYSRLLAQNLAPAVKEKHAINAEFIRLLYQTSALHDLGKVAIPDSILLKPAALTVDEFEVMKSHTVLGSQTLDAALHRFPNARFLQMARDIAISHHERFDGTGYPAGIAADQIPFCGRLVALADVYDALTSRRVYKKAMTHEQACQFIIAGRGRAFDPDIVDAFRLVENQLVSMRAQIAEEPGVEVAAAIGGTAPPVTDAHCSILVVEDSPMVRRNLVELLSATGNQVLAAENIADALKLFIEHCPEVVVSDWEMPGGTGLELCRQLRARASARPAHFIMLTVHTDHKSILEAYQAGINDFVSKPYNPEELLARVQAGLRVSELHRELARKTERLIGANAQLKQMNRRLDQLAITDELTGLYNRRHGMVRLEEHWLLAERYNSNVSVAAIDIDHFKQVNDTFGHAAGDAVLRQVAGILRECTRRTDIVCRIGGEEFIIIFPSQTLKDAFRGAERCRAAVARHTFSVNDLELKATISAGVATRAPAIAGSFNLVRAADAALYRAKDSGRNRVLAHEATSPEVAIHSTPHTAKIVAGNTLPAATTIPVDMEAIAHQCAGDMHIAQGIVRQFRIQAPKEMRNIETALASADSDLLRRGAHTMKSMCAYMTAGVATDLCVKLQAFAKANQWSEASEAVSLLHDQISLLVRWIDNHSKAETSVAA